MLCSDKSCMRACKMGLQRHSHLQETTEGNIAVREVAVLDIDASIAHAHHNSSALWQTAFRHAQNCLGHIGSMESNLQHISMKGFELPLCMR